MSADEKWRGEDPDYKFVEEYRAEDTEPDPLLRGNPMAMVFPPPMDDKTLLKKLLVRPKPFPPGWKEWVLSARLGLLEFITMCHYVFLCDLELAHKVLALVRATFRRRDPRDPRVMRAILQVAAGKMVSVTRFGSTGGGGGLGILVIGISGVGKSSALDRVVKFLGAYGRIHTSLNGEPTRWPQLGVIRVNVGDTWKDTLKRILAEANRQLGRDLHHAPTRATTLELAQRVRAALSMGWAPVLMLDEIQRLANLTPALAKEILNGAIDLMSGEGIPVVLVGNEMVRRLFSLHKAELAKFSNGGERKFGPLEEFDEDTANFIGFLKCYAVSLNPIVYEDNFDHMLWVHCMGIKRIMVEYMRCVLERHAKNEAIKVGAQLLQNISENEMIEFERVLSTIRRLKLGHKPTYAEYQEYEEFLEAALRNRKRSQAEFRLQAEWQGSSRDSDQKLVSAQDFLELRERLLEEEAAEEKRLKEEDMVDTDAAARARDSAGANSDGATDSGRAARSQHARQVKQRLAKAKKKLQETGTVLSLDQARRRRDGLEDGVDPGDIR